MVMLPSAVYLFKANGISLKDEIYDRKTIGKDILIGIVALAITEGLGLLVLLTYKGRTDMAYVTEKPTVGIMIMWIIALGLVSGIVKEIFFRGLAKIFCGPVLGEITAFLLFNVMFAMLDWHNYGYSFIIGIVWIWAYKKTGHLLAPMIAHGGANIVTIFYFLIVSR
jgi:membrane protease YdiL (CAAX protease family)